MLTQDQLFKYLEKKIPNFIKTRKAKTGELLFNCPNYKKHKFKSAPSATFSPSGNVICLICGWKGSLYDCIRILESEYGNKTDAEITLHLVNELKLTMYNELEQYEKYGWSLIPILQNSKIPFEKNWVNTEHKDKITWIKWLNNGLNIGLNVGKSNIIVIDVDNYSEKSEERIQIINLLENHNTLKQKTPNGGFHYLFVVDPDIPQAVNIAELKIDTRCLGGQIIIAPSHIDNRDYEWINLGVEIQKMSQDLKDNLLRLIKVEKGRNENLSLDLSSTENISILKEGEGRNTLLTSLGGAFINKFNVEDTAYILSMISNNFFKPPLPDFEIKALLKSLDKYKISDEESQEKTIYNYLKLIQNDVSAKDIMESTGLKRAIIDKILSKFVKEGKAIRLGRGRYQYREKVEWSDKIPEQIKEYEYKIPLFNDIAIFADGDVLILGGKPNDGKTTIALNILKGIIEQGIKPFYIFSEAGSRFQKTSEALNIAGKYYHTFHENPLAIELEPNSFTVLDWLCLENKAETDIVLRHLNNELQRKRGILIIFTQLKQDYSWFAPNLITHFPTFAARLVQDNQEKTISHFDCDKIKEPRGNFTTYLLQCEFDSKTKIFKPKNLI